MILYLKELIGYLYYKVINQKNFFCLATFILIWDMDILWPFSVECVKLSLTDSIILTADKNPL